MIFVILGIIAVLVLWAVSSYNKLVKLKIAVEEAFATMDVYLKKRFDLIPNLVSTVKGYAKHESETLEKVIVARNKAYDSGSMEDKINAENQITGALKSIFALSESYPDLKANQNFISLQNDLKEQENDIANSRKYYNAIVKDYNIKVQTVPTNIIAGIFGFKTKPMFEVTDSTERENVKVEF